MMSGVILTSTRSRRCWRALSCPAAWGIKCVKPSSATTSPSWMSSLTASLRDTIVAICSPNRAELDRGVARSGRGGHPPHRCELVHGEGPAEPSPPAVLDSPERHLRLVVHRLVVDVHDACL